MAFGGLLVLMRPLAGMEPGRGPGAVWGWLLILIVGLWAVAEGFPEKDLVGRLPGQPKVSFRQFAGYVDVDVDAGRSLFYYFAEAQQDPHLMPLTLWLNGGLLLFFHCYEYIM